MSELRTIPRHVRDALAKAWIKPAEVSVELDAKGHLRIKVIATGARVSCAKTPSDGMAWRQIARGLERATGKRPPHGTKGH
jgi:hypothetical protein